LYHPFRGAPIFGMAPEASAARNCAVPVDTELLHHALQQTAEAHGPGLYGLVRDGSRTVYEGSQGVADLRDPRPIRSQDRFRIGSVTKTFTATLVLLLSADGVLDLDDPLARWVPGLVPDDDGITVEVLLRLRSGLPDYGLTVYGDSPERLSAEDICRVLGRYWAPEKLVAAALSTPGRIAPDQQFRYSNTDYILLGLIVEAATGERVDAQLWQRLFSPLDLDDTTLPIADPQIRGHHAEGYLRRAGDADYGECTSLSPSEGWTAGGIVSTPGNLAHFFDALLGGDVLGPSELAAMTDCREHVREGVSRGLGIERRTFPGGVRAFTHHGGTPGFTTVVVRSDAGRTIVLYQNGIDIPDILSFDAPFITAALADQSHI
jgi:D-alanyl-D-alanine carboxypeptidase